ncbi:hypothetical protein CHISP_3182 [Chitinispirillum alkaliphilum]|nr:hypothetical protein CHISP_3182 [Chitinispirillum alkaliphilum]
MVLGVSENPAVFNFGSLAEYLSDYFHQQTLFIPAQGRFFVDENSGKMSLNTVVIPVADQSFFDTAMDALTDILAFFPLSVSRIITLHAGSEFPELINRHDIEAQFVQELSSESLVEAITQTARSSNADLIVMATGGRTSFVNKITGSSTQQVVRRLPCPLLSVSV